MLPALYSLFIKLKASLIVTIHSHSSRSRAGTGWFNPIPAVSWRGKGSRWLCGEELSSAEGLKGRKWSFCSNPGFQHWAGLAELGSSVILCAGAVLFFAGHSCHVCVVQPCVVGLCLLEEQLFTLPQKGLSCSQCCNRESPWKMV